MGLEKDLYDCLKTIKGGIYALIAPQNDKRPYSVYHIISDIKTTALKEQCDFPQIRFQIDVYSEDIIECMDIRDSIEIKLLANTDIKCIIYQSFSNVTDEGRVFRSTIDFKLTY